MAMTVMTASFEGSVMGLAIFMLVNSITPGPNNLMLLHGSVKCGFWQCRWHMLGITVGVTIMLWLSYWGMSALVVSYPAIMLVIKVLGTLYLLWLTYQMAKSDFTTFVHEALRREASGEQVGNVKPRFGELPLTFWQAVLFQWLNPKAWTMTMVAPSVAMFYAGRPWLDNYPLLAVCAVVNILSISCWAAGGHWLRKLVHLPLVMRVIHGVIVLMTLYCALTLWM
ncbi:LysE family translocator [Psychrobacter sp. LV10R520-6]|uniref:LysE family translocator n=1 Tax=Psychrobacter sp. LV10R520-6 TaxID=1415574 RepID=UPI0024CC002C|nr:LysE family translocator [Psychrobacter sp. LV10R520-6]SNT70031.1 Threonine/homoserine/homoserine lactone efflux protein [Psychrobacter sp. LV10R520-6]